MSENERVWIYQSNREFTDAEAKEILSLGKNFIEQWTSHGALMKADFEIRYNRFLIITADEKQAMASGCSIDKSVHFMKELEKKFSLSLLDRSLLAFREGEKTGTFHFSEFEKLFSSGKISEHTIIFNNLVSTKAELEAGWEIPVKKSWLMKSVTH